MLVGRAEGLHWIRCNVMVCFLLRWLAASWSDDVSNLNIFLVSAHTLGRRQRQQPDLDVCCWSDLLISQLRPSLVCLHSMADGSLLPLIKQEPRRTADESLTDGTVVAVPLLTAHVRGCSVYDWFLSRCNTSGSGCNSPEQMVWTANPSTGPAD